MRFLSYLIGISLLFALSIPLLLLFILIEDDADVLLENRFNQEQIANLEQILIDYDPRYLASANGRQIEFNETEVNALLFYVSQQLGSRTIPWLLDSNLIVDLQPGIAIVSGSIELPRTLFGRYINFEARLAPDDNRVQLAGLTLAGHPVPAAMLTPILSYAEEQLARDADYALINTIQASISDLHFDTDYLGLRLDSTSNNLALIREQARRLLIDSELQASLSTYQRRLIEVVNSLPQDRRSISLTLLLPPLFAHALSEAGDPGRENQAIFMVLSCYLLDELSLQDLLGEAADNFEELQAYRVTLENRDDLPRHLIASAAIASTADDELANIVSIFKEVQDSKTESGFSFSDITANLIGTRLGTYSAGNGAVAERLQRFFAEVENESDYMPAVGRPDGISEAEFIERYESRNSDMYLERLQEIESTISVLPVFQSLQSQPETTD